MGSFMFSIDNLLYESDSAAIEFKNMVGESYGTVNVDLFIEENKATEIKKTSSRRIQVDFSELQIVGVHDSYHIFMKYRLNRNSIFRKTALYPNISNYCKFNEVYDSEFDPEDNLEIFLFQNQFVSKNFLGYYTMSLEDVLSSNCQDIWVNLSDIPNKIRLHFIIKELLPTTDIPLLVLNNQIKYFNSLIKFKRGFDILNKSSDNLASLQNLVDYLSNLPEFIECFTICGLKYSNNILNSMIQKDKNELIPKKITWIQYFKILNRIYSNMIKWLKSSKMCQICHYYPTSKDCDICQLLYCTQCCKKQHYSTFKPVRQFHSRSYKMVENTISSNDSTSSIPFPPNTCLDETRKYHNAPVPVKMNQSTKSLQDNAKKYKQLYLSTKRDYQKLIDATINMKINKK